MRTRDDAYGIRSKSQLKRLGQRQLDQSLHQLATHPAWKSGLGISNHVAALDPKFVQEIDCEEAVQHIKDAFDYDAQPVKNPESLPRMFCSCQESHPGLCKADDCFNHVQLAVQQFQQCLEEKKIQGCALLKLVVVTEVAQPSSSSSQPSQIVPSTQWFLLGCVSKRPLCLFSRMLGRHLYIWHKWEPIGERGVGGAAAQWRQ